jgi:Fe-S-cluster containining protein
LFEEEPRQIEHLDWPKNDPLHGTKGLFRHGGKTYLAHRGDGACVFLNEANGLCRIHEQFGMDAKPISCRMYPFQITATFEGEASVTARFDCPTVRRNQGKPHDESLPQLRKYADRFPLHKGFDDATCCHLDHDQISAVAEFIATLQGGFAKNDERAMFIVFLTDVLALTAADQVDRPALASVFGPLKAQIESAAASPAARPGRIYRAAFRTLLALYLRRDEDILDGRVWRVRRLMAMIAFVFGFGSFRGLGLYHPSGPLGPARLFESEPAPTAETFSLAWRLIRNKLEAFQFLGPDNGNRDFITGLRSLALIYPLMLAAARHRAATRNSATIDSTDVDYAVAAIDHSFGRSAVLAHPLLRPLETFLLNRAAYTRLVRTL